MAAKKGGLGRGLDALFADAVPVYENEDAANDTFKDTDKKTRTKKENDTEKNKDGVRYIKLHDIMPNLNQPRKTFKEEKIEELAASIKEHGIIQPIVVRKRENGYEIVAGERRWRAARKAELTQVPCLVRELSDEQNMLFAIIENMQREDLNPIEEAEGLQRMMQTFGMTQEQVSKSVGKRSRKVIFRRHMAGRWQGLRMTARKKSCALKSCRRVCPSEKRSSLPAVSRSRKRKKPSKR